MQIVAESLSLIFFMFGLPFGRNRRRIMEIETALRMFVNAFIAIKIYINNTGKIYRL